MQNDNRSGNNRKQSRNSGILINDNIPFKSFVLIDENGTNLGQMSKADALDLASKKQLDVLVISKPNSDAVIAKLLDYGRHLYEQKRKKRESKKKQSVIRVKEINLKPTIGQNDLKWRANNATKWLDDGYRVKFTVKAFNRMITREEIINGLFDSFKEMIGEHGVVEKKFTRTAANTYEAIIVPNKNYKPTTKVEKQEE